MTFDVGVAAAELLPQATLGRYDPEYDGFQERFGRKLVSGIALGVALQNLGGQVEYSEIYLLPLPQTFRMDLMWVAYRNRWLEAILVGQQQKILVALDPVTLGYQSAIHSLFHAWDSGDLQGSWISRLGIELTTLNLISVRTGLSRDHGAGQTFTHIGLGLGPEWGRANLAWVHLNESDFTWWDGFRLDLSANLNYEKLRRWLKMG